MAYIRKSTISKYFLFCSKIISVKNTLKFRTVAQRVH